MGTMLYAKGVFINKSFRRAQTSPSPISWRRCTRSTSAPAGPTSSETNTFGREPASSSDRFGLADRLQPASTSRRRRSRGARGAREQAVRGGGRSGPASAIRIEPWGPEPASTRRARIFREQGRRRSPDGGVGPVHPRDVPGPETKSARRSMPCASGVGPRRSVAQMTTEEDGQHARRHGRPRKFTPELEKRRARRIIGVNCAVGPAPMLDHDRAPWRR